MNMSLRRCSQSRQTYRITSRRIHPTQPVYDAVALVYLIAVLRIILMNVEREEGGVDRTVGIQGLEGINCLSNRSSMTSTYVDVNTAGLTVVFAQMRREPRGIP